MKPSRNPIPVRCLGPDGGPGRSLPAPDVLLAGLLRPRLSSGFRNALKISHSLVPAISARADGSVENKTRFNTQ